MPGSRIRGAIAVGHAAKIKHIEKRPGENVKGLGAKPANCQLSSAKRVIEVWPARDWLTKFLWRRAK